MSRSELEEALAMAEEQMGQCEKMFRDDKDFMEALKQVRIVRGRIIESKLRQAIRKETLEEVASKVDDWTSWCLDCEEDRDSLKAAIRGLC